MPGRLSHIYGLRIIERIGPAKLTRILTVIFWLGVLVWVPSAFRPDLLHPADLGSDSSNYAAAGERLAEGSTLYRLQPGDRPVPQDNPPEWSGAILSPPPVALPWTTMLVLPAEIRFHLTWALGLAMSASLGWFLAARLPAWMLLPILFALFPLGVVAWSGNLNALLAPALVAVWCMSTSERSRAGQAAIGVIIAVAALVKLGPVFLLLWLVLQRRAIPLLAAAVTGVLILGATALIGGLDVFAQYAQLLLSSASAPSPLSIPGVLAGLGLPSSAGYLALLLIVGLGCLAMVVWRRNAGATFAIAVLLGVIGTTVVRVETLVVAVAALAPWATERFRSSGESRPSRLVPTIAVASVTIAVLALGVALFSGGTRYSTMALTNESGRSVVVRFTVPGQYATFGYELAEGQAGMAWVDEMGTYGSVIAVMTMECQILHDFRSDPSVSGWTIHATSAEASTVGGLGVLPYSPLCAEELRFHREGLT